MTTGTVARRASERSSSVGSVNSAAAWSGAIIVRGGDATAAVVSNGFYAAGAQMDVTFVRAETHRSSD